MKPTLPRLLAAAALALACAGCASSKSPNTNVQFDFGPLSAPLSPPPQVPLAAVVVMDATGSAALDSERMVYRLSYANAQQAHTYANSRWTANPLMLVTQRLKTRLAQAGIKVLAATDASNGIPILRVEVDDFSHTFSSSTASSGRLVLRASLFHAHTLLDQRSFARATPAPHADAAGGAWALAASTDAVAADLIAWFGSVDARQR